MKKTAGLFLAVSFLFLCGCGKDSIQSSISVSGSGTITEVIVEDAKEDTDIDEIRKDLDSDITEYYISTIGENIKLSNVELKKDKVIKEITYGNYQVYNGYRESNLFAGSIHSALEVEDNTYFYDTVFLDAKKKKEIKAVDVIGNTSDKVVIFDDDYIYKVDGKISYISENVELLDKKSACLKDGESGLGYIIYK